MTYKEASDILDDYDVNFDGHTAEEVAEAFDVAFRALENTWIPVNERLPDDTDEYIEYLVTDAKGQCGVGFYHSEAKAWDSINWGWLEREDIVDNHEISTEPSGIGKVVAWMPLPDKYEG